jgi:hypothetical protein
MAYSFLPPGSSVRKRSTLVPGAQQSTALRNTVYDLHFYLVRGFACSTIFGFTQMY